MLRSDQIFPVMTQDLLVASMSGSLFPLLRITLRINLRKFLILHGGTCLKGCPMILLICSDTYECIPFSLLSFLFSFLLPSLLHFPQQIFYGNVPVARYYLNGRTIAMNRIYNVWSFRESCGRNLTKSNQIYGGTI